MATPIWKFILAQTSDNVNIGELEVTNKQLQLVLNRPGGLSFKIPMDQSLADEILAYRTYIKAYRNGSTGPQLVWSGPVWNYQESAHENSMNVSAVGWFELLNKRSMFYEKIYTTQFGGTIALDVLAIANAQRDGALTGSPLNGTGTLRPTGIVVGTRNDTQTRTITYQQWHNIGQIITELSDIENGYDFEITPDTRTLNIYNSAFPGTLRRDRTQAQFGYQWGPNNLLSFSRSVDMSTLVNSQFATGRYGHALSQNTTSMDTYGMFTDVQNLQDVNNNTILQAFANGEVAIKSFPRVLYTLLPHPWGVMHTHVPEPFVDYRIGDHVYLSANTPRFSVSHQAVRVYGMNISIDDNGTERLTDLQVSP